MLKHFLCSVFLVSVLRGKNINEPTTTVVPTTLDIMDDGASIAPREYGDDKGWAPRNQQRGGKNCGTCRACPEGYTAKRMGNCDTKCVCEWKGSPGQSAITAKPNRLLISLLSSLGNSADSIAQMAVSLREELKLAQELSLSPRN